MMEKGIWVTIFPTHSGETRCAVLQKRNRKNKKILSIFSMIYRRMHGKT